MEPISLEQALTQFERDAAAAAKVLAAATRELKKVQSAAAHGDVRGLRSSVEGCVRLMDQANESASDLGAGWTFDEVAHFDSGAFAQELLALASSEGVQMFESDDRLLCYPAVIQIMAADASVSIDKQRDRKVRPSVLIRTLKALQQRPPKFKPAAFLESLASAYDLVVATTGGRPANARGRDESGPTVKLVDVHQVLTLMPGAAREYTRQEFARDVYLLDQSSLLTTRDGRTLSLPASALTRGSGVLTTVTRSGQPKVYAGVAFSGADT